MSDIKETKNATIPFKTVSDIVQKSTEGKAKATKSLILLIQKCGNAFIGQLAMELALVAEKEGVKTISGSQVYTALDNIGFDDMVTAVKRKIKENKKVTRKRPMMVISEVDNEKIPKITK